MNKLRPRHTRNLIGSLLVISLMATVLAVAAAPISAHDPDDPQHTTPKANTHTFPESEERSGFRLVEECAWKWTFFGGGCEYIYVTEKENARAIWGPKDLQGVYTLSIEYPRRKYEGRSPVGRINWTIQEKRTGSDKWRTVKTFSRIPQLGKEGHETVTKSDGRFELDGQTRVVARTVDRRLVGIGEVRLDHVDVLPEHKIIAQEICIDIATAAYYLYEMALEDLVKFREIKEAYLDAEYDYLTNLLEFANAAINAGSYFGPAVVKTAILQISKFIAKYGRFAIKFVRKISIINKAMFWFELILAAKAGWSIIRANTEEVSRITSEFAAVRRKLLNHPKLNLDKTCRIFKSEEEGYFGYRTGYHRTAQLIALASHGRSQHEEQAEIRSGYRGAWNFNGVLKFHYSHNGYKRDDGYVTFTPKRRTTTETTTPRKTITIVIEPPLKLSVGNPTGWKHDCRSAACRYFNIEVDEAVLGRGPYEVNCFDEDSGESWGRKLLDRNSLSRWCYFGHPGRSVYVTVDRYRSNSVRWPSPEVDRSTPTTRQAGPTTTTPPTTTPPTTTPPTTTPLTTTPPTTRTTSVHAMTSGYASIAAGYGHSCGLRTDATVICWGNAEYGKTVVPDGLYRAISASSNHSCGLRTNGTAVCWGRNVNGETAVPEGQYKAISAGDLHSCGLRTNGTAVCWGDTLYGKTVVPDGLYRAISASSNHSCGLRTNGTAVCWGFNGDGQTDVPDGQYKAISAGAGGGHSCGLRTNGTGVCWGSNGHGQTNVPDGQYSAISAGTRHSCGLRTNGTAVCWGDNEDGETMVPNGHYKSISVGNYHSCGIRTNGTVVCWGWNYYGQTAVPDR